MWPKKWTFRKQQQIWFFNIPADTTAINRLLFSTFVLHPLYFAVMVFFYSCTLFYVLSAICGPPIAQLNSYRTKTIRMQSNIRYIRFHITAMMGIFVNQFGAESQDKKRETKRTQTNWKVNKRREFINTQYFFFIFDLWLGSYCSHLNVSLMVVLLVSFYDKTAHKLILSIKKNYFRQDQLNIKAFLLFLFRTNNCQRQNKNIFLFTIQIITYRNCKCVRCMNNVQISWTEDENNE